MGGYSLSFILDFVWSVISTSDFWAMTIRMTTPVLFAALGSCIASKAGIFNMSIEGLINSTAFISVLADGVVRKMALGGKKKSDFVDLVGSVYADKEAAEAITIQYGGSMNDGNAKELLAKVNVDGGLIGGASLKADAFAAIVDAAQ